MKIAVYGQQYNTEHKKYVDELIQVLKKFKVTYVIEQKFLDGMASDFDVKSTASFNSYHDLDNSFDFMFTVGGDGTILRAVTFVRELEIPIVGINTGRLGFLATIQKEEISFALAQILNKEFQIKERTLLSVTTTPNIDSLNSFNFALNEVSVSRKDTPSMITVETSLDGEYLTSYWADGLIVATPTGSTGYSLSCGGPIITPQAKSFALTPIAPHNLNARPLVVPDDTIISLKVQGRESTFFLSLDSRITSVSNDTSVIVKKANFNLKMAQVNDRTFIKTLREKLLWGLDTRN
jgi:NAD+ kinase